MTEKKKQKDGKKITARMKKKDVIFLEGEYDMDVGNDGRIAIRVPLSVVAGKLPQNDGKVKAGYTFATKAEVDEQYEESLEGTNWKNWIALNFEQTKSGTRTIRMYGKLCEGLSVLVRKYGQERVRSAMAKCLEPRQATLPYVQTIINNEGQEFAPKKQDGKKDGVSAALAAWGIVEMNRSRASKMWEDNSLHPKIHDVIRKMGGWDDVGKWKQYELSRKKTQFVHLWQDVGELQGKRIRKGKDGHGAVRVDSDRGVDGHGRGGRGGGSQDRQRGPQASQTEIAAMLAGIGKKMPSGKPERPAKKETGLSQSEIKETIREAVVLGVPLDALRNKYPDEYRAVMG